MGSHKKIKIKNIPQITAAKSLTFTYIYGKQICFIDKLLQIQVEGF